MVEISKLADELSAYGQGEDGVNFEVLPIPSDIEVLQIQVEDREELPIFISYADSEIICICYLFKEDELKSDTKNEMHEAMLTMNVTMPLSSFAKINDQYVVFGALSASSDLETIIHEIEVLSDNTIEAISALQEHLK